MTNEKVNINLKETKNYESGLWNSMYCINATTEEYHTESDYTYTFLTVPLQRKIASDKRFNFLFRINEKTDFCIPLTAYTSIMFSGKYLYHCQSCDEYCKETNDSFISFGAYGDKRLFQHIKKSFHRKEEYM